MVYIVLAVVSFWILIRKKVQKNALFGLMLVLFLFTITAVLGMIKGTKLYVHRGNIGDKEIYLSQVVYMGQYDINGIVDVHQKEYPSDVLEYGYSLINSDRPIAALLCAVLTGRGWGDLFYQGYLFIMTAWIAIFCSMICVVDVVTNGMRQKKFSSQGKILLFDIFFAALYTFGFYGQIQYDIDAWSQIVSGGGLLAFTCIYFIIFRELVFLKTSLSPSRFILLMLTGAGAFLVYPENTMIHGAILIIVSVLACIHKKCRISVKEIGKYAGIPVAATVLAFAVHSNTIRFGIYQAFRAGSATRQSWAGYFDAYWQGWYGIPETGSAFDTLEKLVSLVPSWCGMFMIMPDYEKHPVVVFFWFLFAAVLAVLLIALFVLASVRLWKLCSKREDFIRGCFWLCSIAGICIFLAMVFLGKYWSAGKLLLYISPFLYVVLSDYTMRMILSGKIMEKNKKGRYVGTILTLVSVLFVVCQTVFAGMRVFDLAVNENCTGYLRTYPSDQHPKLKTKYPYQFDAKKYADVPVVAIRIKSSWYQDYVKLALAYEGIAYYAVPDSVIGWGKMKEENLNYNKKDTTVRVKDTAGSGQAD